MPLIILYMKGKSHENIPNVARTFIALVFTSLIEAGGSPGQHFPCLIHLTSHGIQTQCGHIALPVLCGKDESHSF